MSDNLDAILALAEDYVETTVTLSPDSLAVLFYAVWFVQFRSNWIGERLGDQVTDEQWAQIEDLVDVASRELMTETMPIGTIQLWPETIAPERWIFCRGQLLDIDDYPELFEIIEFRYGGNAPSGQFGIPDFMNYSPMGAGSTVPLNGNVGTNTHTLTANEMPVHNHSPLSPHVQFVGLRNTGGSLQPAAGTAYGVAATTANAGGGAAHNNIHPVLGINFIIFAGR